MKTGDLQKEQEFFRQISELILKLILKNREKVAVAKEKGRFGYATQGDVLVEKTIIGAIKKRFPKDLILSEENNPDTKLPEKGRIWIIDPICGTINFSRGINNFCTNIALVENGKIIAANVVDHNRKERIWSVGSGKIYLNNQLFKPKKAVEEILIEVDFGSLIIMNQAARSRYVGFLNKLITETNYVLTSLNTSLGFAYTAIGKINGFFTASPNLWDIAAAAFLIQQAGGIVTDLSGHPWELKKNGIIAAISKEIHSKILECYENN